MTSKRLVSIAGAATIAATVGLLAALGVFAGAGAVASPQPPATSIPPRDPSQPAAQNGGEGSPTVDEQQAFAALRDSDSANSARQARSAIGRDAHILGSLGSAQQQYGISPHLARKVGSIPGGDLLLVPGSSGICLVRTGAEPAAACAAAAGVEKAGILLWTVGGDGAPSSGVVLAGVMPDGARDVMINDRSGASIPATLDAEGAFATTLSAAPAHVTFMDRDGNQQTDL